MNDIVTPGADGIPSTPAEAATRLDQLKQDPVFREALMRGGPEQKRTFHELHELVSKGDGIDQAMSGVLPAGIIQDSAQVEMAGATAMNRELGIRDDITKEFLTGHTTTKGWYDETARLKADRMSNPEWVKRLQSGDVETRRQFREMNIVLTGGIKEKA